MSRTECVARTTALVLLACSPSHLVPQGTWSAAVTTGGPAGLFGAGAAYDLVRGRLVMFGGFQASYATVGDTWEFDGRNWAAVATPGPVARGGHQLAFDFTRACVVLFGGTTSALLTIGRNDTWEFDGLQWRQCQPAHAPVGRFGHAMTYDVHTGGVLLHGGRSFGTNHFDDTWCWNGSDWTQVATTGPSPRSRHAMCYDVQRCCTVLFGGASTTDLGDTWEWNGTIWQQAPYFAPGARSGHRLVYHLQRGRSILHGGSFGGGDTWEWDGATWTNIATNGPDRNDGAFVFDSLLHRATWVGGMQPVPLTAFADVQTFGDPLDGTFVSQGSSCAGSAGTAVLAAPTARSPGPTLGATSYVQAAPVPSLAFFVFGLSDTVDGSLALPHDLTPLGMPGCALRVSRDAVTSVASGTGHATLAIDVPFDPFLVGLAFYVQAFPLDLAANALGFTTTNVLAATVGRN